MPTPVSQHGGNGPEDQDQLSWRSSSLPIQHVCVSCAQLLPIPWRGGSRPKDVPRYGSSRTRKRAEVEAIDTAGWHFHCYITALYAVPLAFLGLPKSFCPSQWTKEYCKRLSHNHLRRQKFTRECLLRHVGPGFWAVHWSCP